METKMNNPNLPVVPEPHIHPSPPIIDHAFATAEQNFITQVFAWMGAALCISAAAAGIVANSDSMLKLVFGNPLIFYGLLLLEILMVGYLSRMVDTMPLMAARAIFLIYSAINGITLSLIFVLYTTSSIAVTFLVTAGAFGAMALYGYYTKKDLTSWGSLLFMLLIGLILASIVNIIWYSQTLDWVLTYAGIFIFTGLTAYDMQKIKSLNSAVDENSDQDKKEAIMGALALYLDFINLFLRFLRIFGKRK